MPAANRSKTFALAGRLKRPLLRVFPNVVAEPLLSVAGYFLFAIARKS